MSDRLQDLSAKGDDPARIAALVDFVQLRPDLERAVPRSDGGKWSPIDSLPLGSRDDASLHDRARPVDAEGAFPEGGSSRCATSSSSGFI